MARTAERGVASAAGSGLASSTEVAQGPRPGGGLWLRLQPHHLAAGLTVLALAGHRALWGWVAPWGQLPTMGITLLALALVWVTWARTALHHQHGVVSPQPQGRQRARVLVDEGPFRYTRNPIALGTAVGMLGAGLAVGLPFMAWAAATLLLIQHRFHIPHEEAQLQRAFGGWYSDYAASVRRWL